MKFAIFAAVFFLVLSFFAFGQSATVQEARTAGYNAGYISSVPSPSNIPTRFKQTSGLERAYIEGYQEGYKQKQYDESVRRGYRVDPIFDSTQERTNPRGPDVQDNNSVGVEFKWPF